jgi:hypothetical protein
MHLNEADFKLVNQKGNIGEFVYRPENYPGPIAINATVKKEDETYDITDEIATLSIKKLILLFNKLDQLGYTKLYFDGYNASIEAIKGE